jgi:hypothetical protein
VTPEELATRLERAADRLPAAIEATMRHEAILLVMKIRANASGPPGPNRVTGDYTSYGGPGDSWQIEAKSVPGGTRITVGTVRPQGLRLEFGFVGTDSLGRTYNQAPRPHMGPAVEETVQDLPEAIKRTIMEVIG